MYRLEDAYWWFVGRRRLAIGLLRKFLRPSHPVILDLGCGTGVIATELASWSEPVGLDFSEKALAYCQSRGLKELIQARGEALPLRDRAVDGVLALDIFEHIEDDQAAFAEAFRVLRPGGVLVLSVPAFRTLWGPHDVALMHFRRYRRAEVVERLKRVGFTIERASYSVFFLFPIVVLIRILEKMKRGEAQASLPNTPVWMNRGLISLQNLEAGLIGRMALPWGSSVIAVARRPE
jgi:ubiquinone/menaquinone biosynthesis C-methylase UbiE